MKEKIPFIRKRDIIVFAAILLIGLAGMFFPRLIPQGESCTITLDGSEIYKSNLATEKDRIFTLNEADGFVFEIRNHKIRILDAPCDDHVCVKTGFIGKTAKAAVCLPHKLVVTVEKADSGGDADIIIG